MILARGTVQGVGFRPFVHRLAHRMRLTGWVRNDPDGVRIQVEGSWHSLEHFERALWNEAPPAACIDAIHVERVPVSSFEAFVIEESASGPLSSARVPADRATCASCLNELFDMSNRRVGYAFTTCADCGPRYSLIDRLPYDRSNTRMRLFAMCPACLAEYRNPGDRRFHAESIACPSCGPRVVLRDASGAVRRHGRRAIQAAARLLRKGGILALKGIGGFQLLARADCSKPLIRLREAKRRPTKPFAVMVASLDQARRFCQVDEGEEQLLASAENPIVLLQRRGEHIPGLAPELAPGVPTIGIFLPTSPLHALILAELGCPLVATSGNRGDEPIALDGDTAQTALAGIAGAFLDHDRPILRRADDPVIRVVADRTALIRVGRGYAPLPLPALERFARARGLPPVLAAGGHQKSAFALWTGGQAVLSPHIGDLNTPDTRAAFESSIQSLSALYAFRPTHLACDLHPDYFSTRWANSQGLPLTPVQHHHAHAVAGMVEHDILDREVIALCWDGTGLGSDGTLWGGEALRARIDDYTRVASLEPFPLTGGEAAIREPRRIALALLAVTQGAEAVIEDEALLHRLGLKRARAEALIQLIQKGVGTVWTTSVGRLFDAVSAWLLGMGEVSYEGEAAVRLESVACHEELAAYPLPTHTQAHSTLALGDWRPLIDAIAADMRTQVDVQVIAARFHNTLAQWAADIVAATGLQHVVLGGGCFQNRLLVERVQRAIELRTGARVHTPGLIPQNDGGLAAGQLGVALGWLAHSLDAARVP